ncbi:type II secretion system F family protein [Acidisoma cellulosilytica]|uniref:Type II secretion system F family protein n=1 Tax=Acidisoma cellulosilyticum TaxID=2802395 RepID=A0A964E4H7_9PROT|nr:type II secretion system F family protein [Acidisoma cellulosilyticum]MCB8881476.1 type II secretion system F family protein [Acidisoma cellulosilyticum]
MAVFRYRALSAAGDMVTGEIEAPSEVAAIARLNERTLLPIQAVEKGASSRFTLSLTRGERLAPAELALFIQQLARLLAASLPLDRALEILTTLVEDGPSRRIVARLLGRVRDGSSLAEAMSAEKNVFPRLCISMVRAGEEGGAVRAVLERVAEFLVRSEAIRQKVISALVYPVILTVVALGSVALILTLVIPQFETMFTDAGAKLPMATRIVLLASKGLRGYWLWLLLGLVLLVGAARGLGSLGQIQRLRDRLLLRLPLLGGILIRFEVSRLCRSLAVLLANGVPAARALSLAGATVGNRLMVEAIETLATRFKEGAALAPSLEATGRFPPLAVQLIQIGEETGRLAEMLQQVADIYDQEVERVLQRGMALLIPVITIVMGLLVAFIMAAVMTAMVSISELAG